MADDTQKLDNPLAPIGNIAREGGEIVDKGLGLIWKSLSQLTGDTYTAALFAIFLLFTLTLLRGAASSRNVTIYSGALAIIGTIGTIVVLLFAIVAHRGPIISLFSDNPDRDFLYKGLTGHSYQSEYKFRFVIGLIPSMLATSKWYALIFLNMAVVGVVTLFLSAFLQSKRTSNSTKQETEV